MLEHSLPSLLTRFIWIFCWKR